MVKYENQGILFLLTEGKEIVFNCLNFKVIYTLNEKIISSKDDLIILYNANNQPPKDFNFIIETLGTVDRYYAIVSTTDINSLYYSVLSVFYVKKDQKDFIFLTINDIDLKLNPDKGFTSFYITVIDKDTYYYYK
jgi:hypothetical protein